LRTWNLVENPLRRRAWFVLFSHGEPPARLFCFLPIFVYPVSFPLTIFSEISVPCSLSSLLTEHLRQVSCLPPSDRPFCCAVVVDCLLLTKGCWETAHVSLSPKHFPLFFSSPGPDVIATFLPDQLHSHWPFLLMAFFVVWCRPGSFNGKISPPDSFACPLVSPSMRFSPFFLRWRTRAPQTVLLHGPESGPLPPSFCLQLLQKNVSP